MTSRACPTNAPTYQFTLFNRCIQSTHFYAIHIFRALEEHLDRVDLREAFHNTGLMVDRTGTVTTLARAQKQRRDITNKDSTTDPSASGSGNFRLTTAQLADSVDSRGGFGFDLQERDFDFEDDNLQEQAWVDEDAVATYGSRTGTADPDIYRHNPASAGSRTGTAHSRGLGDLRLRPVPAFLPVTTDKLKAVAKAGKYAARDTRHLVVPASPGALADPTGRNAHSGSPQKDLGYMLHDGDKYGDGFEDSLSDIAEGKLPHGGSQASLSQSQSQSLLQGSVGSLEHTVGSNLSTGQTGKQLKLVRPNTSGSVIDAINTGRHSTDATIGLNAVLDALKANARNPKVNIGVRGTPQKPIDWSQIALPSHLMTISRLASDQINNKVQNFNVKERRELYKALGNFIPRSARKPATKSGGGRAGTAGKTVKPRAETAPAAVEVDQEVEGDEQDPSSESATSSAVPVDQFPPNPNGSPPHSPAISRKRVDSGNVDFGTSSTPSSPSATKKEQNTSFNAFTVAGTSSNAHDTGGVAMSRTEVSQLMEAHADTTGNAQAPSALAKARRTASPNGRTVGFEDDYLPGTGDPHRSRAGTPGGFGGALSLPGFVIGADDGGLDIRHTKSAQEQHAEALVKASNTTEAVQQAEAQAAAQGRKHKKTQVASAEAYLPAVPLGRVRSAGELGISGRPSPARPFRNYEDNNALTDIHYRPQMGANTHANVAGSEYYMPRPGEQRTEVMSVATYKTETGNLMWNKAINAVGLSTAESREQRDTEISHFTSHRYLNEDRVQLQLPSGDHVPKSQLQTPVDSGDYSGVESRSPPRSPGGRSAVGSRAGTARLGTALDKVQEENGEGDGEENDMQQPWAHATDEEESSVGELSLADSEESEDNADGGGAIPAKAAAGYGGDMQSFFDLFQSPDSDSDEEKERKENKEKEDGLGALASKGFRKGAADSSIMTTEELEEVKQASITEKMRLGANLPNSMFKRLFDKTGKPILSKDLGRTMGVPKVPTTGMRPIRSATTGFRDSGQHIGYLRIATPDDPPMQRPISLIDIAKQQRSYIAQVREERQGEVYKELKKDASDKIPRGKQRAAAYPVPDKFWEAWRRDNRLRYPNGIDRAKGTSSTNIRDLSKLTKNADGTVKMDADARERLLVKTPGQALVYRRKMAKKAEAERQRNAYYSVDDPTVGRAKLLVHDLLGLRADQSTTDLLDKKSGLTKKTGSMQAVPLASMNRKPGAFKAPVL